MKQESQTRRLIYRGRVQGVGFRATTRHIAGGFAVSGFVRNLADGTVELVACGEPEEVARFLAQVARQFGPNIVATDELPIVEPFSEQGFTIR